MQTIELSVMSTGSEPGALQAVLRDFEAQHHARVQLHPLEWETSWTEIMRYALYGHGPAVSEVGSTWVASLARMNVLRAFSPAEVAGLGGSNTFLPAVW